VLTGRAGDDEALLASMGGGSEPPTESASATAGADAGVASDAPTSTPDPDAGGATSLPSAASTEGSEAPEGDTTALLAACADTTGRRDQAVRAAQVALGNWTTHYGAQLAYDRGEISSDEAKRRWAASKEPAQRNLDALAAATDAIGSDDPCAQLDGADAVTGAAAEAVRACVARADLASGALDAAQQPLQGWRDHLQMMASKERYGTDEYLRMWDRTVSAAPDAMRGFDSAAADWREAPACEPAP
jgi:hypothetical protein